MLHSPFSSTQSTLSPHQALRLAKFYLENAHKFEDSEIALALCDDARAALSRTKTFAKKGLKPLQSVEDQALRNGIAAAYFEHGSLLERLDRIEMATISYKKAEKWGYIQRNRQPQSDSSQPSKSKQTISLPAHNQSTLDPSGSQVRNLAHIPLAIFNQDVAPAAAKYPLPKTGARLESTPQLAYCLALLPPLVLPMKPLDEAQQEWSQAKADDKDEQDRLHTMATDLTKAFINDVLKSPSTVAEVVCLAPILDQEHFRRLLMTFIDGIGQATLLELHLLEGLAHLMQCALPDYLDADDLVKILEVLSTRLMDTHQQSTQHIFKLSLVVSHVLDAMADCHVKDLKRVELHEPLSGYLNGLKSDSDPYLVYQAAYAFQALQYVPDDESPLQATFRRTRMVVKGIAGIVSAVKGFDVNGFIDGLAHLQDGLVEVYEVAKIGYDGAKALVESGQDLFDSLKEGLSFAKKRAWYPALRGIDTLIRDGRLAEVRRLICEAPCRRDLAFQWGVCQRLGEIAANPLWDLNTRRNAIDFLGEVYKNDTEWGQEAVIKQWILNILKELTSQSGSILQSVETLLRELSTDGDIRKQGLYQACLEKPRYQYPLAVVVPQLASPSLLDRVQNKPDIESDLRRLKERRLNETGDAVYIPPQAKPSLQAPDDALFSLMDKVQDFLRGDQKVMLLLGDSGAGKSTFNRALECELWNTYKKKDGQIPLLINLAAIDKPDQDLVAKHLRRAEFTELQIKELKSYRRFILICDGYDESQQSHNLYTSNRLNQPGEWNVQMVISCRSESLGQDYRDRFQPSDHNRQATHELFQEAVIAPFSPDQVQEYIKKYVSTGTVWQVTDYLQALELIPNLQDLVKNPFMLTLTMEVLPRIVDPVQELTSVRVTRVALYDQFVEQWLERGKRRLADKDLSSQERKDFERLVDDGFTQNGIDFLKDLACAIYKHQAGYPLVTYSRKLDQGTWKQEFFSRKDENQLLLEACPLTRGGNQYRFIHKSILEYCLARAVFEPQDEKDAKRWVPSQTLTRRGSAYSLESFESQDIREESTTAVPIEQAVLDSPLAWKFLVGEPSIVQFLAERVQQEPIFRHQLVAVIELSKTEGKARKAAANAITILVRAGVRFNGMDLKGIQVPGADLSGGQFDSVQLQAADLRNVNLRNIWLRRANLNNARMSGVQFGEWPYLQEDSEAKSCAFSTVGHSFAVGLDNSTISVYDTAAWVKIHSLQGHTEGVVSVTYSPSGHQIASGSWDDTVRVWDVQTGTPGLILSGHTGGVLSVTYSPSGHQIASGSSDKTIRLWDAQTGAPGFILSGHTGGVRSVIYSPNGRQIASGSHDEAVRLWDAQTGATDLILSGHNGGVASVKYSPNGHQIASGSDDMAVRLWDAHTGAPGLILRGHTDGVRSVAYSPNGHQIASGSGDKTVRLWDVQTGAPTLILSGHTDSVVSVTYSSNGHQIASASFDKIVRLWDAHSGAHGLIMSGHAETVRSVTYSPIGHQIASGSDDKTVRLWDAHTGAPGLILSGHTDSVRSVKYSPNGHQIASGSGDETVRLWDAQAGAPGLVLSGHTGGIWSVIYSPNGHQIASGSSDKTVRLWDVRNGAPGLILSGHTGGVLSVTYSPNGCQIASGSGDETVRLWDAQTGAPGLILRGHTASVWSVSYSPNGCQIASGSYDKTVRLWDAQTGAPGPILSGHTDSVYSVTYSSSGRQIVSGSRDETARMWDVASGQCLVVVEDVRGSITGIALSSTLKGLFFATGSGNFVRTWKVTEEEDQFQVYLLWSSAHNGLSVSSTLIQDTQGLSKVNIQLLRQRGAVGDPTLPWSLREAGRKLTSIVSVASRLKVPANIGALREP
ncbi:hypothetical protein BGZ98_001319 [Dissophora globulifera]|nr:hypothetical protein BGZ98_001319 [Dissophora globulifera]